MASHPVTVRIPDKEHKSLIDTAHHRGMSIGDYVRDVVRHHLNRNDMLSVIERATREALAQSAELHREHVRELEELFARAGMAIAAAPPAPAAPIPPTKVTSPSLLR